MREIKFRAWDKDGEEMVSWDRLRTIRYNQKNEIALKNKLDDCNVIDIWNAPEFKDTMVQYIGRKDKAGVEIYEGDIVKRPSYRSISFNYPEDIMFVIRDRDKFTLNYRCDFEWEELEVIGHIYENPELLKEANGN